MIKAATSGGEVRPPLVIQLLHGLGQGHTLSSPADSNEGGKHAGNSQAIPGPDGVGLHLRSRHPAPGSKAPQREQLVLSPWRRAPTSNNRSQEGTPPCRGRQARSWGFFMGGAFMRPIIYTVHGACKRSRQDQTARRRKRSSIVPDQTSGAKGFPAVGSGCAGGATVAQDGKTYNRNTHTRTPPQTRSAPAPWMRIEPVGRTRVSPPLQPDHRHRRRRAPNTSIEEATMNLSRRVR